MADEVNQRDDTMVQAERLLALVQIGVSMAEGLWDGKADQERAANAVERSLCEAAFEIERYIRARKENR